MAQNGIDTDTPTVRPPTADAPSLPGGTPPPGPDMAQNGTGAPATTPATTPAPAPGAGGEFDQFASGDAPGGYGDEATSNIWDTITQDIANRKQEAMGEADEFFSQRG